MPPRVGTWFHPLHWTECSDLSQRLDTQADLSRGPASDPGPDDGDPGAAGIFRAGCGEPAPALCQDAGALAGEVRKILARGPRHVRRKICARLAVVPRRFCDGISYRLASAVSGRLRARLGQPSAVDSRLPLREYPGRRDTG